MRLYLYLYHNVPARGRWVVERSHVACVHVSTFSLSSLACLRAGQSTPLRTWDFHHNKHQTVYIVSVISPKHPYRLLDLHGAVISSYQRRSCLPRDIVPDRLPSSGSPPPPLLLPARPTRRPPATSSFSCILAALMPLPARATCHLLLLLHPGCPAAPSPPLLQHGPPSRTPGLHLRDTHTRAPRCRLSRLHPAILILVGVLAYAWPCCGVISWCVPVPSSCVCSVRPCFFRKALS